MQHIDNPAHNASTPFKHNDHEHLQHLAESQRQVLHFSHSLLGCSLTMTSTAGSGAGAGAGTASLTSTEISFFSDMCFDIYIRPTNFFTKYLCYNSSISFNKISKSLFLFVFVISKPFKSTSPLKSISSVCILIRSSSSSSSSSSNLR